jgi:hypothetical protein
MDNARPETPAGNAVTVGAAVVPAPAGLPVGEDAALADDIVRAIAGSGNAALRWPLRTRSDAAGNAVFPADSARRRA